MNFVSSFSNIFSANLNPVKNVCDIFLSSLLQLTNTNLFLDSSWAFQEYIYIHVRISAPRRYYDMYQKSCCPGEVKGYTTYKVLLNNRSQ